MRALRRRMIEDMELAGLAPGTRKRYLTAVAHLARTYDRSPDRITEEEVRRHVLSLRDERGVARGTFETHWHGIRFFYLRTLCVDWDLFSKKKRLCLKFADNLLRFAYANHFEGNHLECVKCWREYVSGPGAASKGRYKAAYASLRPFLAVCGLERGRELFCKLETDPKKSGQTKAEAPSRGA